MELPYQPGQPGQAGGRRDRRRLGWFPGHMAIDETEHLPPPLIGPPKSWRPVPPVPLEPSQQGMNESGILRRRPAHRGSGPHHGCHVATVQRLLTHEPSLPPPELAIATVIGSAPSTGASIPRTGLPP